VHLEDTAELEVCILSKFHKNADFLIFLSNARWMLGLWPGAMETQPADQVRSCDPKMDLLLGLMSDGEWMTTDMEYDLGLWMSANRNV